MLFHECVIDGYNLMHAAGLARATYGPRDLERARDRLLKLLARNLEDRERPATTVYFDAKSSPSRSQLPGSFRDLRVIFAGGDGEADTAMEHFIERNATPKRLLVVTSDHRIQRAARVRRCPFIDSPAFLDELFLRSAAIKPDPETLPASHPKHTGGLSPGEVDEWLSVFADRADPEQFQRLSPSAPAVEPPPTEETVVAEIEPVETGEPVVEIESGEGMMSLEDWERRIAELWEEEA